MGMTLIKIENERVRNDARMGGQGCESQGQATAGATTERGDMVHM